LGESSEFQNNFEKGSGRSQRCPGERELFSYEGKKLGEILDLNAGEIRPAEYLLRKTDNGRFSDLRHFVCPKQIVFVSSGLRAVAGPGYYGLLLAFFAAGGLTVGAVAFGAALLFEV
jgi:hypothetical protein